VCVWAHGEGWGQRALRGVWGPQDTGAGRATRHAGVAWGRYSPRTELDNPSGASIGEGGGRLWPAPGQGAGPEPGAEVDKVELNISAQYTRIYPYSCRSCVFLMYSVHAPTIIMCLNNSLWSGYNVTRVEILCLSLSDSRNRLCATTTVSGSPCDAAGEKDANVGYQISDRSWTFANKREMCLAHLSRMPGPRREGIWVTAA